MPLVLVPHLALAVASWLVLGWIFLTLTKAALHVCFITAIHCYCHWWVFRSCPCVLAAEKLVNTFIEGAQGLAELPAASTPLEMPVLCRKQGELLSSRPRVLKAQESQLAGCCSTPCALLILTPASCRKGGVKHLYHPSSRLARQAPHPTLQLSEMNPLIKAV